MDEQSIRLSKLYSKYFSQSPNKAITEQEFTFATIVTLDILKIPERISIMLTDIDCGRGYYFDKKIILPKWIGKYHVIFQIYYMVHEICHCLVGNYHTPFFKITEDYILALWGIEIVRKKVYPRKLFFNGVEIVNVPDSMKTAVCDAELDQAQSG